MPINVDFGNVKAPPLPPDDTYVLTISDCQVKPAKKNTNTDECVVLHMDYEIAEGEFAGKKLKDWIYVEFSNPWSAMPFFSSLQGRDVSDEPLDFDENDAIGERVTAVCEIAEHNGRSNLRPTAYIIG